MSDKAYDFPVPPKGYYWKVKTDWIGPRFTEIQLRRRRKCLWDQVVFSQYLSIAIRFPDLCYQDRVYAVRLAEGVSSGRTSA